MAIFSEFCRAATSYSHAFPGNTNSVSQAQARAVESAIFNDALSKEDYHQCWNNRVKECNNIAQSTEIRHLKHSDSSAKTSREPGQTIGPFTNCTHHATGLFSTVYKTSTNTNVLAIKLTTLSQCQPPHDPKREARLLHLAAHTNIIPLLSTHTVPSHFLLVFPFQPIDLETLLHKSPQPLTKPQSRTVIRDLFSALSHLHSLGMIHRDVKPSNIMLSSPNGPAYLADFGIAWSPTDPSSEPVERKITDVGTTCYRAPELLFGHKVYNHTLDLWAAGCVLAEIFHALHPAPAISNHTIYPRTSAYVDNDNNDNEDDGGWTLFSAGALGSELALIKSIFETLGTPNNKTWPEAKDLPDWNKMSFVQFPAKKWDDILPGAEERERELVAGLVRYQSSERWGSEAVLEWEI